jgi:hypothetical protein
MNINKTGLPLAIHRKKSVSFRDKNLLQIFQVAMQTLGQLVSGSYGQIDPRQVIPEQYLHISPASNTFIFHLRGVFFYMDSRIDA